MTLQPTKTPSVARTFSVQLILWSLITVLFILNMRFTFALDWRTASCISVGVWMPWSVIGSLMILAIRRFDLGSQTTYTELMLFVLGIAFMCVCFAVLSSFSEWFMQSWLDLPLQELPIPTLSGITADKVTHWSTHFTRRCFMAIPICLGIAGISVFMHSREKIARREIEALEERAQVNQSRIEMLYAQLRPHFLFNALNTISALVHQSPDDTVRIIGLLSHLLRQTLESTARSEVSLDGEIELVKKYFSIEQARFGSKLQLEVLVPQDLKEAQVPALILQPLVENAVRHGISPKKSGGRVTVTAMRSDTGQHLRLLVQDDGVGIKSVFHEGIGLSNTRARLRLLYGADAAITIAPALRMGAMVWVEIPWRTAS
jgi:two-component system, LytTR family, sensor kinase